MNVGTVVAIVAAVVVGYGGLVALILNQVGGLRGELKSDNEKLAAKVESVRTELKADIAEVNAEVKSLSRQVADVTGELRQLDERMGHLDRLTERLIPTPRSA
ncbi:MAG: hypothetical protein ACYDAG_05535 [Chloroflexota bacterium]